MAGKKSKGQVAARFTIYSMRVLIILAVVAGLMVFAFFEAMNMANIYILASDGMYARASSILMDGSKIELEEFFLKSFLDKDQKRIAAASKYDQYFIRDFEYKLEIEGISVMPWSTTASMTAVERIPSIDGELPEASWPEGADANSAVVMPPAWENARYKIEFKQDLKGRWFISNIEMIEKAPVEKTKYTPAPLPTVTAKP